MSSSTATPVTAQPSGMSDNFIAWTSLAFLRRNSCVVMAGTIMADAWSKSGRFPVNAPV
ncbi:hypothetical protein ACFVUH_03875 [Kitasatospora sp. NPDC058032]|uniref:hypothetical protein n=1 Tax=Kitasatospora sp. NPDC058032 TaxID=3346307 RepID=UPI0036DB1EA3